MRPPNANPPTPNIPRPPVVRPMESYRSPFMPNSVLPGFYVTSEEDISAKDVPTDGSISFFPFQDLSKIVIKQWNGQVMETAVYTLQQGPTSQNPSQLPPPPPPMHQPESQTEAELLNGFRQMNEGLAGAFNQLTMSMQNIQANLERLNSRFSDDEAKG